MPAAPKSPSGRLLCQPEDFDWIAEQNPLLVDLDWREVASVAGAIVANDILDRVKVRLYDDIDTNDWVLIATVDAYTDGEGEEIPYVPLDAALGDIQAKGLEEPYASNLIALLRKHADRLESELATARKA